MFAEDVFVLIGISRFEKAGRDEVIHNMKNKWGKKSNEKKA